MNDPQRSDASRRDPTVRVADFVLLLWALLQLAATVFDLCDAMTLRIGHTLLLLVCAFLLRVPTAGRAARWALFGGAVLAAASFGILLLRYPAAAQNGGQIGGFGLALAALALLLIFVAGLRYCRGLTVLAALFLLYCFFGKYLPGALGHGGFSLRRVLGFFIWGSQGVFGVAIGVSATYLFLFMLFGALLQAGGFGQLIHELTLRLAGASAGGPAKIAVITSGLLGMVNGSAVANVATTGAFTIPLMKKTGYSPEYAGAVEAAASTGGQLTPPVMGAAAFVLAEFLGVPYGAVALAAVLPAALYYGSLLLAVHLEARRLGLRGVETDGVPTVRTLLRTRGHLLLSPAVLIALLCCGFTPLYAAAAAMLCCIVAAQLRPATRQPLRVWLEAFRDGARAAVPLGVCCAVIGVIIGAVSLTGVGLSLGSLLLRLAERGSLTLCGLLTTLLCTVLGMGVPGVAAYVIVSTVAAPALIRAGAVPMAAHLFCLYYACLSNITPPVAMSALTAAGIAGGRPGRTALLALRLAAAAYVLPFAFLHEPALLLGTGASVWAVLRAVSVASVGLAALCAGFEGRLRGACRMPVRVLLLAAGVCCTDGTRASDPVGLALIALALLLQWMGGHHKKESAS